MDTKSEVEYRILRMVISNLFEKNKISSEEKENAIIKLIEKFNPPIGKLERDAYGKEESL